MDTKQISLFDLLKIDNTEDYNVHLACRNTENQHPLDVFFSNEEHYKGWQEFKGNVDEQTDKIKKQKFTRDLILSFAQMYNDGNDLHLFTGVYKIVERLKDRYRVEKLTDFEGLIGRLKVKYKRPSRNSSFLLNKELAESIIVHEVLPERLVSKVFTGYNNINLTFLDLETIIKNQPKEWYVGLKAKHGIYLIIDSSNNKKYVGSARGEDGIWGRWSDYIDSYTGGNKRLIDLYTKVGPDHFKKHCRFVLLEYFADRIDAGYIAERETFWKEALNTKNKNFGYNEN